MCRPDIFEKDSKISRLTFNDLSLPFKSNVESSAYSVSLYSYKLIPKIVESDGTVIKNQKEILEKTKSFYQSLYGSREDSITNIDLENELHFPNIPKLSQEEIQI